MRVATFVGCSLVLIGCGGEDFPIDADAETVDARGSIDAPRAEDTGPSRTTTIVASEGGTARSLDGLFEIIVAPGALAEDTVLSITRVADADVPSDVAATDPISGVYAVEPDGLEFGGDGALVHYHFDTAPSVLVAGGRARAAFAVARPREIGDAEWLSTPTTALHEGAADIFAPLPHLSYQWAVAHDPRGNDYFLSVDFDDPHVARVGDRWSPRIDVQATVGLRSATVRRMVASAGALEVESSREAPSDELFQNLRHVFFGDDDAAPRVSDADVGSPPLAADRPHDAGFVPRFYCARLGADVAVVSTRMTPTGAEPWESATVVVSDPEPTECVEQMGPEISILDTLVGVRDDTTLTTPDPSELETDVESHNTDTHTAILAGASWAATFHPPVGAPAPGPDTITATNSGATVTATRDPVTGQYASVLDDPAVWDIDAVTAVTFGGLPMPRELMPAPPLSMPFGALAGLDTMVHGSDDGELELRVRFPGTLRCMADDVEDFVVFRRLDGSAAAVPLREGLMLAASYCGRTIEDLTALPFVVEVTSVERAQLAAGGDLVFVRVGHQLRVDGSVFTTVCPPGQTYCFDRCTNTTTDPLHCGGCAVVPPIEVCDEIDNDCDGIADENCPRYVFLYSGDNETSPHFGDTTRPAGTNNTVSCGSGLIGLCGSTNSDGSIRQILGICGGPRLRRIDTTAPYSFAIDMIDLTVTPCLSGLTGGGSSGGAATFEIRCPSNMIAEGISGEASTTIESLRLHCAEWVPTQTAIGDWVIRRGATMATTSGGSGDGGAVFSWFIPDEPVDMNPGLLRNLRNRWFSPMGGISDVIDLSVSGRAAELR